MKHPIIASSGFSILRCALYNLPEEHFERGADTRGANAKFSFSRHLWGIWLIAITFCLTACDPNSQQPSNRSKPQTEKANAAASYEQQRDKEPELLSDPIEMVFAEFASNSARAQQKFVGKQMRVQGIVTQILKPSVFLKCPSSDQSRLFEVEIVLNRSEEIMTLNTGQSVTAIGIIRDGNPLMIYLKNCVIAP